MTFRRAPSWSGHVREHLPDGRPLAKAVTLAKGLPRRESPGSGVAVDCCAAMVGRVAVQRFVGRRLLIDQVAGAGLAQLTVVGAAAIRLPMLYRTIGPSQLGTVAALTAVVPVLLVPTAGVRVASRATSSLEDSPATRLPLPLGLIACWGVLAFLCPLLAFTGLFGNSGRGDLAVALAIAGLGSCCALLGAPSWGHLEARGRFRVPNVSVAACSLLSLGLTVLLRRADHAVVTHTSISVLSACGPFLLVLGFDLATSGRSASTLTTRWFLGGRLSHLEALRAVPPLATRVTDPLFLSALVSQASVADYSLALRAMLLASFPFGATLPFWASEATKRSAVQGGREQTLRMALLMNGVGSVVAGGLFWFFGGPVVGALTGTSWNRWLFFLLAVTVPLQAVTSTCTAVVVGTTTSAPMLRLEAVGLVINVSLTLGLTAYLGVVGPALATVFALVLVACLQSVFVARRLAASASLEHVP